MYLHLGLLEFAESTRGRQTMSTSDRRGLAEAVEVNFASEVSQAVTGLAVAAGSNQ